MCRLFVGYFFENFEMADRVYYISVYIKNGLKISDVNIHD